MFNKLKTATFFKIYYFYFLKLLEVGPQFLLAIFIFAINFKGFEGLVKIDKNSSWQDFLRSFCFIGGVQFSFLSMTFSSAVSRLVGFPVKFRLSFKIPKPSNNEDIQVIKFTPCVKRETIIFAKFTAIFTYFFLINLLLLTLPLFFYFLVSLSFLPAFSFLLLNGLVFCLVSFLLLIPYLFYLYEDYSFLSVLIPLIIFLTVGILIYFFYESIKNYFVIIPLAAIPLSILSGYLFLSLYRRKFLKKDLV